MITREEQIALAGGSVDEALIHLGTWLGRRRRVPAQPPRDWAASRHRSRTSRPSDPAPGGVRANYYAGLQVNGESIPIAPDNRDKLAATVESARKQAKSEPARVLKVAALRKLLKTFLDGATAVGRIAPVSEGVRRSTFIRR